MSFGLPISRPVPKDAIFPLPIAPIELAFVTAEQPQYPMQFQIRGELTGALQREPWHRACAAALTRHPLLAATLRQSADGSWLWEPPVENAVEIRWSTPECPASTWQPIDIQREPGVQIVVDAGPQFSRVLLQVHHACCDATGALQFLADICELYAAQIDNRPPNLRELQPDRLLHRDACGISRLEWCLRAPQDGLAWLALYEYWFHRPLPLGAADAEAAETLPLSVTLSEPVTSALRSRARAARVTLNDLLVTAWFQTLHAMLCEAGRTDADGCIRIVIPVNLRRSGDELLPAANRVSLIYLDRRPGRFRTPQALLRSVHRELWLCKLWNAGLSFLRIVSWRLWWCEGRLSPRLSDRCLATAVLSNLGETWQRVSPHDGTESGRSPSVSRLEFAPPVAPLVSAALGVVTVNGQMTVTLNSDRRRISSTEAETLLRAYERRLLEWLDQPM